MHTIDPGKNQTLGISNQALKNCCVHLNYMGLLKFLKRLHFSCFFPLLKQCDHSHLSKGRLHTLRFLQSRNTSIKTAASSCTEESFEGSDKLSTDTCKCRQEERWCEARSTSLTLKSVLVTNTHARSQPCISDFVTK